MKLTKLVCPHCGGNLDVDLKERDYIHCPYCQNKIEVDDGIQRIEITKNIHKKYTNEAKIVESKNEFRKTVLIIGAYIALMLVLFIGIGISEFATKQSIKHAIEEGKITAGNYDDLEGENYKTVKAHFESAGFKNIQLVELKDSGFAIWQKGKVVKISIGGNTTFTSNDYFDKKTKVVISYH